MGLISACKYVLERTELPPRTTSCLLQQSWETSTAWAALAFEIEIMKLIIRK